jgi:hypothetical protein
LGADTSYVVASLFAVTHVPQSQQSIASGIVGTTGGIFRSIMTSIAIALISSIPLSPLNQLTRPDIGGSRIEDSTPTTAGLEKLIKGFQAQFWFGFAATVIGSLLALTLRVGKRGTLDEIRESNLAKKVEQEKPDLDSHSFKSQET